MTPMPCSSTTSARPDFTFRSSGTATVADLSGNGHTGTLGTGFGGATAPTTHPILDIDDNGAITALTDGLLMFRYDFSFTGANLTTSAVGDDCKRCAAAAIAPYIAALATTLDIDDNTTVGALTDALLALRFLSGFTGEALTTSAVGGGCGRCDAAAIAPYLQRLD